MSCADDNTPYRTVNTINEVIQYLEHDTAMLFKWFSDNQMKASISKCHLLMNNKLKLNFNEHLNNIIINALSKVITHMGVRAIAPEENCPPR